MQLVGALAALDLASVAVAAMLLLLLYAERQTIGQLIGWALGLIPGVGGVAKDAWIGAQSQAIQWVAGWVDTGVGALVSLFEGTASVLYNLANAVVTAVETIIADAASTVQQVQTNILAIEHATTTAEAYAEQLVQQTKAQVARDLASAEATALADAQHALTQAAAYADQQAGAAVAHADALAVQASDALQAAIAGVDDTLGRDVAKLTADAQAVTTEIAKVTAEVAGVSATVGKVAAIPAGTTLTDVEHLLSTLGLAAVPAIVTTIATEVETMRRECVTPTCNAITPQLPVMNALADGLLVMSVLELAASLIANPTGEAEAVVQMANGIEAGAAGVLQAVGVRL